MGQWGWIWPILGWKLPTNELINNTSDCVRLFLTPYVYIISTKYKYVVVSQHVLNYEYMII